MHLDESARIFDHHPVEASQLGLRPELQPATTRGTDSTSPPRRRRDDDGRLSRRCLRERLGLSRARRRGARAWVCSTSRRGCVMRGRATWTRSSATTSGPGTGHLPGGHNRGGGAALQRPPGFLTQGTRREDPPLQCPLGGWGDVAALTTKTYGSSESESPFLFVGESLWGGTSEL